MGFPISARHKVLQMTYGRRKKGLFSKVNKKNIDEMEKEIEKLFKPKKKDDKD